MTGEHPEYSDDRARMSEGIAWGFWNLMSGTYGWTCHDKPHGKCGIDALWSKGDESLYVELESADRWRDHCEVFTVNGKPRSTLHVPCRKKRLGREGVYIWLRSDARKLYWAFLRDVLDAPVVPVDCRAVGTEQEPFFDVKIETCCHLVSPYDSDVFRSIVDYESPRTLFG